MSKYEDFEIVIEKVGGADMYTTNVRQPCDGKIGDASSFFSLEEIKQITSIQTVTTDSDSQLPARHFKIVTNTQEKEFILSYNAASSEEAAKKIGSILSKAVFEKPGILERLGECKAYCKAQNAALRIRIDLSRTPELATLPWEYLRSTDDSNFVCLDKDTTLVRYLRTSDAVRPLKVKPPLKILVMASTPKDLPQLASNDEIKKIRGELEKFSETNKDSIKIEVLEKPTKLILEATLNQAQEKGEPFHIFHFIGHGAFDKDKQEGVLLFENDNEESVAFGHEDLGRLFQPYRSDLRLLVLNACEGAKLAITNSYSSVATKIMQIAEIPAAIAMQFSITDSAAINFATTFYGQLAKGASLEKAVDTARLAINDPTYALEEWGTPVFYLRAKSGHLFDIKIPHPPMHLEGHYNSLREALPMCKLVIFLGLNINAADRPLYDSWEPRMGVPTAGELCSYLGRQYNIPSPSNSLAELAQTLLVRNNLHLMDEFSPIFGTLMMQSQKIPKLYEILAKLTKIITNRLSSDGTDRTHKGLLFVTTTYDKVLEKAFVENDVKRYHLIRYERDLNGNCFFSHREYEVSEVDGLKKSVQKKEVLLDSMNLPNEYTIWRDKYPVILKLPGEVSEESEFAITEDDFFALASKPLSLLLPPDILTQIKDSRHLYLGYDLQSWTLRLLRNRICEGHSLHGKRGSYAVVFDENDDPNAVFWRESGIRFATAMLEDYVAGLEQDVLQQL